MGRESAGADTSRGADRPVILAVDDTPENLDVLTGLLQPQYRVRAAVNGARALRIATSETPPDLVLLDVMMPEMDGFEVCRRLKADPATREIPVIFLTAKTETEDILQGFEVGAVDYVAKPFRPPELLARVNLHLTLRRLQKELIQRAEEIARMKREHEAFLRHELKNRIQPIMGYSQMLALFGSEGLNEQQRKCAAVIHESAKNMTALIDAMKQLQDIEAGNFEPDRKPADLPLLIEKVVSDLKAAFGDRARVRCENGMAEGAVPMDANLMAGAFQNLIKNAIEHVSDLPEAADRVVTVALRDEGDRAIVSVRNGGEPVPPEKVATFFEKFNTGKKGKGGTGLGTTYAYLVTRAHGGEIGVASNAEEGTTVTLSLPRGIARLPD
jgi:CheY-like chemotaxis protein